MEKRLLLGICLVLLVLGAYAQQKCGADAAIQALEARQPGYREHLQRLDMEAQRWVDKTGGIAAAQARYTWPTATIPVVVHIVYNTPAQNLPDSQIVSQMEVLNEDFRRLNADTVQTRNIFRPFAADTKIQFCLASRDPSGNPTTGITRTSTAVAGFTYDDKVKFDTSGGKDAWDPAHYLNIWVCNLTSANGYAYYPNIQPAYDGVVLNYNVVGRVGPVIAPYDRGRTATHEVGHWLGLYHPFEGFFAGTGCGGSDTTTCASMGDHICDTPGDITPSYGCDTMENSCTDLPIDYPDQIENFMDYADDDCVNMFSMDQADRMNGFLYTARAGLLTSLGCVAPGSGTLDAAVLNVTAPVGQVCNAAISPEIILGNVSAVTLTSAQIDYQIDGGAMINFSWSGSLAPGATVAVALPTTTVNQGMHTLHAVVSAPNGGADANAANDAWDGQFAYDPTGIDLMTVMWTCEGFELSTFPPAGWRVENPDQNYYTWELSSAANGNTCPGSNAAKINNFYLGSNHTRDALISPVYEGIYDLVVHYDYAYMAPASAFYQDTFNVYWSDDCGVTWALWSSMPGVNMATAPNAGFAPFVPANASEWSGSDFVFGPLPITSKFQFKFENASGWGNDLWLDNISFNVTIAVDPSDYLKTLHVSPNPAQDWLKVDRAGMLLPVGKVEVVSVWGQVLQVVDVEEGMTELEVNVQGLAAGIYYVRYVSDDGGMGTRGFVKD